MTSPSLYMLDTNTASYLVSGRSAAVRQAYLETEPYATIVLSAITEAELRFGLEKKPGAARLRSAFEDFFGSIKVLPWDSEVARSYGRLRADMSATGKTLSLMDLLIASHAVAVSATLVSHDRAFQQLSPVLTVVDWATDV